MARKVEAPAFEILAGSISIKGTRYPHARPDPLEWCAHCDRFHRRLKDSEKAIGLKSACTAQDRAAKLLSTPQWKGASVSYETRIVTRALPVCGPLGWRGKYLDGVANIAQNPNGMFSLRSPDLPEKAETRIAATCAVLTLGSAVAVVWGRE